MWRMPPHNSGGLLRFVTPIGRCLVTTNPLPEQTLRPRPQRADARRNYDKVLAAAREAFAEGGASTSLEEIARRAEVGIGTLYRHFPNRQALLEAVYARRGRGALPVGRRPRRAACRGMRSLAWLHRFVAYMVTKQALAPELLDYVGRDAAVFQDSRAALYAAGGAAAWSAPSSRAPCAPTPTWPRSSSSSAGSPRSRSSEPAEVDHILDIALDGLRYQVT